MDLGAGTAADLEELRRLRPEFTDRRSLLVDGQRAMLREVPGAVRDGRGTGMICADLARLPVRSGSAGLVLSIGTLCCVEESAVPRAIAEASRILAPGGILVLAVPRWRGRGDETATAATGLVRHTGGRPGHAIFQKVL